MSIRRRSLLRLAALVLLLPTLHGCLYFAGGAMLGATLGAASTPRPLPATARYPAGAALLVDFVPSRDVAGFVRGERDSLRVPGTTRLVGELRATRGDTLWIAVSELRREAGGPMAFAHGHEPVVPLSPETPARIHVIASNGRLAERVVIGGLVGLALSYLLLYALCFDGGCFGD